MKSDDAWKKIGQNDPYWGVVTHDKYRAENIDEKLVNEFFSSGEEYIHRVFEDIKYYLEMQSFFPKHALDFGCGVGRLLIPMAKRCEHVTGMDVSPAMLKEAKKNCDSRFLNNVEFVTYDDELTQLKGYYDFINTYIVLQHIENKRGKHIIKNLLEHLMPNGVGAIHVTYKRIDRNDLFHTSVGWLRVKFKPINMAINFIKHRKLDEPYILMTNYNLNWLFATLYNYGVEYIFARQTNHSQHLGIVIYFKKK